MFSVRKHVIHTDDMIILVGFFFFFGLVLFMFLIIADKIEMKLQQHRCEGVVQFTRNDKHAGYICEKNFGEKF